MLQKTKGIVLGYIRYRESSIITRIYTQELGFQSYIVNGVRSKSAKSNKIALFQPLTLLELVVYHNPQKSINRLSEQKCSAPFSSIPFDFTKSSVAIFLGELLNKVLQKEQEPNTGLFSFVFNHVIELDLVQQLDPNFHLIFALQLLSHLGIQPLSCESMYESIVGSYQGKNKPIYPSSNETNFINTVLIKNKALVTITNQERRNLLQFILNFYYAQIDDFGVIKSTTILAEVLE